MTKLKTLFRKSREAEDGLTLVELMVSIVIIVTVLLSSAFALNAAFKAQAVSEIKSRAVEIAREQSEKAKQKNFVDTRLVAPTQYRPGEVTVPTSYKGESTIIRVADRINDNGDLENIGFVHRQIQEENGTKFTILTYVTRVTSASFDAAGTNIQLNTTTVNGVVTAAPVVKRITIVVSWTLDGSENSTSNTVVRTPRPDECIPPRVEPTGGAGTAKWDSLEKVSACEARK